VEKGKSSRGSDREDFYSVACIWPEGDPGGIGDACELIAESFEVI